jgi:integrase
MAKTTLTDRLLKSLKPIFPKEHAREGEGLSDGERYEVMDTVVPGFGIRVTEHGQRTFILVARYPGSTNPTRRAVAEYGEIDLADARQRARDWLELIRQGKDPKIEQERNRLSELQRQENTFAAVAEAWFLDKLPGERKGKEVERDFRAAFLPVWGPRPITDISGPDVRSVINAKKASAPGQARNLLGYAKRFFSWAIDQEVYDLKTSPCENLKPTKIIGKKTKGQRFLSDDELFALWRAAKRLPYPAGPVYCLLILTALRLNEAADASRTEFDLHNRLWIIPAERMKARSEEAHPHAVPLTNDMVEILEHLPRFKKGDYLFSTTFGVSPAWMSSKVKRRIDQRMLRTLRALARRRGDDPSKVELRRWTNHAIRRTVRTNLSRLRVAEEVREAVLAHVRPGIKGVYDLYDYLDEKREALDLWAARLRSIVARPTDNVTTLRRSA